MKKRRRGDPLTMTPAQALRMVTQVTLRELAERSGIPEGTLRKYRSGARRPSKANALKLAEVLVGLGDELADAGVALSLVALPDMRAQFQLLARLGVGASPDLAVLREELGGRVSAINALVRDLIKHPSPGGKK